VLPRPQHAFGLSLRCSFGEYSGPPQIHSTSSQVPQYFNKTWLIRDNEGGIVASHWSLVRNRFFPYRTMIQPWLMMMLLRGAFSLCRESLEISSNIAENWPS